MKLITRIVSAFAINLFALWLASYFVAGFVVSKDIQSFVIAGAVFTLINFFIRPVLKIILSPVIILTLGLGIVAVNAAVLYILDYFSKNVSIIDVPSLIYATLIISAVNIISHFFIKHLA